MNKPAKAAAVLAGAAALLVLGASTHAALTTRVGTTADYHLKMGQSEFSTYSSPGFTPVPASEITVAISGPRMLNATFTAESACSGINGGICSVRIVVILPTGAVVEMDPASGLDFAFDSVTDGTPESHTVERGSPFLPAGTYRVRVEAAVTPTPPGTQLRLDDWTFVVEAIRP